MKKQMVNKGQAGFSLVELMVVVAIIGVLAMMAVPKVNAFIAKSRQSEAKVNLSSFYTFNKNFYVEFQGYTNSFKAMGFGPEGQLRYNVGIGGAAASLPPQFTALKEAPQNDTFASLAACPVPTAKVADDAQCFTLAGADGNAPAAPVGELAANFATFVAHANASLVDDAPVDNWTINQAKNLLNATDGTVPGGAAADD